jgi:hypothetical protein
VVFETVPDKVAEYGVVMMNQVYGLYWRAFSSFRVCLESRNAAAIKHAESRRAQGMAGGCWVKYVPFGVSAMFFSLILSISRREKGPCFNIGTTYSMTGLIAPNRDIE